MDGIPEFFTDPEQLKEALERRKMEGEVNSLAFQSLLAKADTEEMRALSNTFLRAGTDQTGIGIWYAGVVAGILNERTGLCIGCHQDHSVKSEDFAEKQDEPVFRHTPVEELNAYLKQYNVDFTPGSIPDLEAEVYCKGDKCPRIFPSLKDRMLRENCPNCEQRAKWG